MALAGIYEAINSNTLATGSWKKKPKRAEPWPVPSIAAARAKKRREESAPTLEALFQRLTAVPGGLKE